MSRLAPGAADLSPEAIAMRRRAELGTGRKGGYTARELIRAAGAIFDEGKRLKKLAENLPARKHRRAGRLSHRADEALITAAIQLRIAALCPLDKGYLHHLSADQIERLKADAVRGFDADPAEFAVAAFRLLREQRNRSKAEGGPS